MAKDASNAFFTGAFDVIADNVDEIHVCSQQPTNYTEATATYSLGKADVTGADFTEGAGSPSGRKLTVGAITVEGDANGTGNHLALVDSGNSALIYVTTCTSVGIENTVEQEFGAWDITIPQPS